MKTWSELLEGQRWSGVGDEYGPYSQQVVSAREALIAAPWFSRVGETLVADILAGLIGKHLVYLRRLAVGDGIADDGVFVGHFECA